jgi:hypothetical protein
MLKAVEDGREKEEKRKRDGEENGWVTIYTDV